MTEAESAIRDMFQTYLDGYNELDPEKLAGLHANPTIMVHRGKVFTLTEENNVPITSRSSPRTQPRNMFGRCQTYQLVRESAARQAVGRIS